MTIVAAFRAEVIKLCTLPAVPGTLLTVWVASLGLSAVPAADVVEYAQAGFVVLGVLAVTSEYSGGQVRTSLVGVPRRIELLTAKALALTATSVPAAGVVAAVVRSVPAIWYLTLVALLAAGVAALVRRTLPALTVLLGCLFIAVPLIRDHAPPTGRISAPLLAGTLGVLAAAVISFHRRDA